VLELPRTVGVVTVEYIRYRIPPADREAFEDAYRRAGTILSASARCVDYELSRSEESYILRITWASPGDRLEEVPFESAVEETRRYEPTGIAGRGGGIPTLYEWAGGADALLKLTETFYVHVRDDELLAPVFAQMDPAHPQHVAAWLGEVFGGPTEYSATRGGHAHMIGRHLGRALTEQQRRRWVALLIDTADEVGLPADPEFRASFVGYLEWGTRMAVMLSQPGIEAPEQSPMPTWGWALPPYRP
jgi:truncated hemoglobin YjbI